MLNRARQSGMTLIDLLIGLSIAAFLMGIAAPSFGDWISNARIRASAEALMAGAQLARAEAIKRNARVRFQITSTGDNGCALSATGNNWVVSLDNPSGACAAAPSDTVSPRIIQARAGNELSTAVGVSGAIGNAAASVMQFNSLGQMVSPSNGFNLQVSLPSAGTCRAAGGDLRCLRVEVSVAGQVKMCDPSLSAGDPEGC